MINPKILFLSAFSSLTLPDAFAKIVESEGILSKGIQRHDPNVKWGGH